MRLEGWLRAVPEDVELAMKAVPELEHINVSISCSSFVVRLAEIEKEGID